nr:MAG TPA: hypothetical protein [Herelleviridae sp.]
MKEICFQKNLKIMLDKSARVCHNFLRHKWRLGKFTQVNYFNS